MEDSVPQYSQHGIQLNYVGIKELHFESARLPGAIKSSEIGNSKIQSGRSDYDKEQRSIAIFIKVEVKTHSDDMRLKVEMVSQFRVNEELFPADRVEEWAEKAGMFVLLPYLREQVYSLCVRSGLPVITLPMMLVPTFTVVAPTPSNSEAQVPF